VDYCHMEEEYWKNGGYPRYAVAYQDHKGRPQPYREYGVGIPLGQASLGLKMAQNAIDPRDPKKQAIRLADVYDASLSGTIFGDMSLGLAYRYCEYDTTSPTSEQTDQWLQLKVSGGQASKGGALQLAYASGEFIDLVENKLEKTPTSKVSVQYEKRWKDEGNRLTLQFHRTIMPDPTSAENNYEGRLQFDYTF